MLEAATASTGSQVVAGLLGLGAAGVAGAVVAMAWSVHAHQIRLAERLARRQLIVTSAADGAEAGSGAGAAAAQNGAAAGGRNGSGARNRSAAAGRTDSQAALPLDAAAGSALLPPEAARPLAPGAARPAAPPEAARARAARPTPQAARAAQPVVIEGPDTVVAGEQVRYRARTAGGGQVVAWAAGGGAVSQAADPAHPEDLLLVADQPGSLIVSVRVREGLTERRETKTVTAVPDVTTVTPPFPLRLFLQGWGLVVVAVLVVGFAGALAALGNLSSADFIALAVPLVALLAVLAVARGDAGTPGTRR